MQYMKILRDLRNVSLMVSIDNTEKATAFGSTVISTGRNAAFPIQEYISVTDTPIPAPRYKSSNAPKGFPRAHNPKKNAAAVKISEDTKVPLASANKETSSLVGTKY
nr:hypothetical protein [Ruminococcus flavefaciens]